MTLFHISIEKVIKGIEESNYPVTPFDYIDEFVEELHFRLPPPGLVELALYEQDFNKAIGPKERVPLDKIICLEAVTVRKIYQNKGYIAALLNSLEVNFPDRHLCITNVRNEGFAQWIAKREQWQGSSYLHPFWNTARADELNKQLMAQSFVRLAGSIPNLDLP
jgi:GNAT superfamily N-acetyltransferase